MPDQRSPSSDSLPDGQAGQREHRSVCESTQRLLYLCLRVYVSQQHTRVHDISWVMHSLDCAQTVDKQCPALLRKRLERQTISCTRHDTVTYRHGDIYDSIIHSWTICHSSITTLRRRSPSSSPCEAWMEWQNQSLVTWTLNTETCWIVCKLMCLLGCMRSDS